MYPVGLKRRYYFVEHVRGVSIRGLWVGALGATGYLEALEALRRLGSAAWAAPRCKRTWGRRRAQQVEKCATNWICRGSHVRYPAGPRIPSLLASRQRLIAALAWHTARLVARDQCPRPGACALVPGMGHKHTTLCARRSRPCRRAQGQRLRHPRAAKRHRPSALRLPQEQPAAAAAHDDDALVRHARLVRLRAMHKCMGAWQGAVCVGTPGGFGRAARAARWNMGCVSKWGAHVALDGCAHGHAYAH